MTTGVKKDVEEALNSASVGEEIMDDKVFELPDMKVAVTDSNANQVEDAKVVAVKMAFIGLGQGGGNMADMFWRFGYRRVMIMNTTEQDFKSIECPNRLVIGGDIKGAGKDPSLGAKVFEESKEEVLSAMKKTFGKGIELVMICVGAGGGTGGGSAKGAIKLAKEFIKSNGSDDAKVGVMVSMPSTSEGSVVVNNAETLIGQMVEMSELGVITPLVVADNAKILKIYPNTKLGQRWDVINRSVCGLFDSFNVLAAQSSAYATFDPQDYKKVLFSGTLVFGRSVLTKPENGTELSDAIRKNIKGGFLSDRFTLGDAKTAASIIVASNEVLNDLSQDAYDAGFDTLQRVIGSKEVIMYQGIFENDKVEGINLFTVVGIRANKKGV